MKQLICASVLMLCSVVSFADNAGQSQWLEQEQALFAGYLQEFDSSAKHLAESQQGYCANPQTQPDALKQAWLEHYQSWLALQASGLGPLEDLRTLWAISYWPDKKDSVGRAVTKLSAAISLPKPASMAVTQRNLRSLAVLLYAESERDCALLGLVTEAYLQQQGYLSAALAEYLDKAEPELLVLAMVDSYHLQATLMQKKLGAMFSAEHQRLRPYQGEAWRSDQSMWLLRAQAKQLATRYQAGLKPHLAQRDPQLAEKVEQALASLLAGLPQREPSVADQALQPWQSSQQQLTELAGLLSSAVPKALSLNLGFNNHDGD
ncbi:imelysin family protein [Aliagarivorans marinus]|uniref:imelysin family protein n=1 Tax=Aliagarivorans marinus TaxID=561965 RepID=UPI00041A84D5|nr:imelysin family protein [Aliagarivorans marinus]